MSDESRKVLFVDPSYSVFYQNKIFSLDSTFNCDNGLAAFFRLREFLLKDQVDMMTADYLLDGSCRYQDGSFYLSLGLMHDFEQFESRYHVKLKSFVVYEPPLVQPQLYAALPQLTRQFERVYVHNVTGDGYSLNGVDQSKLSKLYWPQPFNDVVEPYWSSSRREKKIAVINSNLRPLFSSKQELYSKRIEAVCALSEYNAIDLFGRGWNKWWRRSSWWFPYFSNRQRLMKVYLGTVASKYETYSHYQFSLCFENMKMSGYISEKIFDCFYAGVVPIYLGAPDVEQYIPKGAFIDCRQFDSWADLWAFCQQLSEKEITGMREAGRAFLQSSDFDRYYSSFENMFSSRKTGV